jgi:hypothetical protein
MSAFDRGPETAFEARYGGVGTESAYRTWSGDFAPAIILAQAKEMSGVLAAKWCKELVSDIPTYPFPYRVGRQSTQGVIRQVEMTPASPEPVSWHAVTRDLNSYRIMSDMAIYQH